MGKQGSWYIANFYLMNMSELGMEFKMLLFPNIRANTTCILNFKIYYFPELSNRCRSHVNSLMQRVSIQWHISPGKTHFCPCGLNQWLDVESINLEIPHLGCNYCKLERWYWWFTVKLEMIINAQHPYRHLTNCQKHIRSLWMILRNDTGSFV